MAHLASLYPFHADPGLGARGPYIGVDITGGMTGFHFDPFELYNTGALTNPNCIVIGGVGTGKSALVKAFLRRELAIYEDRRWIAVLDPKAEYLPFARAHGLAVIRLRPGGHDRLNPMDGWPGDHQDVPARQGLVLRKGVYAMLRGPSYETPAEIRARWSVRSFCACGHRAARTECRY